MSYPLGNESVRRCLTYIVYILDLLILTMDDLYMIVVSPWGENIIIIWNYLLL